MGKAVRKVVIPVAGMGTRFLPVTKAVPKELLPVGTVPILHVVVEEALASGVEEVVLVTSPDKASVADYFRSDTAYDKRLNALKKEAMLESLRQITGRARFTTVTQDEPRGLGHAIHCAKKAVGDEPFLIILPDVIIESKAPCCGQLVDAYEKTGCAVNATEHTPREKLHLYGIYDLSSSDGRFHRARGVVEKPTAEEAPSDLSVVGRYLFPPDLFSILDNTPPGRGGEIQLADAMNELALNGRMIAYEYEGMQFDTGDPLGFLKANIFYGRRNNEVEVDAFMREVMGEKGRGPETRTAINE
ncbi:MAG TPA: UTP--glucose-1-phosphate uridylyltransferase [bacterium]|nr:UTP--glucose-1-phosphate uridylyltransferase [bacterium]